MPTTHVIQFSGGKGSWYTGVRVASTLVHSGDELLLLFADTLTEDPDLYRFLADAERDILRRLPDGATGRMVVLRDGRDIWQVFTDHRYLGNTRIDPCSRVLKRDLIRTWMDKHLDPASTVVYLGIDWTEIERYEKAVPRWLPWTLKAPLCEPPYITPDELLQEMTDAGIKLPFLYTLGMVHNNCGGFCVKAGMAQQKLLLEKLPERYAYHEAKEQELREYLGKDVAVLRDRTTRGRLAMVGLTEDEVVRSGSTFTLKSTGQPVQVPPLAPLTLRTFRERIEAKMIEVDPDDIGGCACFTPDED